MSDDRQHAIGAPERVEYRVQERPEMGDAMIFASWWDDGSPTTVPDRHKTWDEAWSWLGGNVKPGDTILVLQPHD